MIPRTVSPFFPLLLLVSATFAEPPNQRIRDVETPVNRILYHRWTGTSPGAGFTATRLNACELDLTRARIRRLSCTARSPQAMLPHEQDQVLKLLKAMPWTSLSCCQIDEYRNTVPAWLKTKPPDVYNIPKGLGREDGYVETLTVFAGKTQRTTRVNPRPPFTPNDPKRPPARQIADTVH